MHDRIALRSAIKCVCARGILVAYGGYGRWLMTPLMGGKIATTLSKDRRWRFLTRNLYFFSLTRGLRRCSGGWLAVQLGAAMLLREAVEPAVRRPAHLAPTR